MSSIPWSYDLIADVYATDMGRNMEFDDVGFYRRLCEGARGAVLELGCGTGRILLDLLASGADAYGVDRSWPMLARLRRDAAARGLAPRVAQMDIAALGVRGAFARILAPYSLVTYLTDPRVAIDVLQRLASLLAPNGVVALDAFVPRHVEAFAATFADFQLDYRRPHGSGTLERAKRLHPNADGTNRIERRYRVLDGDGTLMDEFVTTETIRPYSPEALADLAQNAGLTVVDRHYDYGATREPSEAHFATLTLAR